MTDSLSRPVAPLPSSPDSVDSADWRPAWEAAFESLVEAASRPGPETEQARARLGAARQAALAESDPPDLGDWVDRRIGRLDALVDTGLNEEDTSLELALLLVDEARWLRVLLARSGQGRLDACLADTARDANSVAGLAAEGSLAESGARRSEDPAGVRRIHLEVQRIRLGQIEAGSEECRGPELVVRLAAAEDVADDIAVLARRRDADVESRRLLERAEDLLGELEDRVEAALEEAPPEQARLIVRELASAGLERVEEALVVSAELPPEQAAAALERGRQRAEQVLAMWRQLEQPRHKAPPEIDRLRKIRRRLAAERQERGLQARLEGIFGWRIVSASEITILVLILLVVGLLLFEALVDLSPSAARAVVWIDTGICAVFLVEFFTKLALVPGRRWRWFGRHFLVDFLPSIPFGVLAHGLAQLNVLRVGRTGRLIRLGRLTRYVRALRPLVRLFRVIGFILRGLDRLVHRHSHLLNRDILLFAPAVELDRSPESNPTAGPVEAQARARRLLRRQILQLPPNRRRDAVDVALAATGDYLEELQATPAAATFEGPERSGRAGKLRFEELLDQLQTADAGSIERRLGVDLTARLARRVRRLDVPVLRSLPFLRRFAPGARRLGDGELLARAARSLGASARRFYDRMLAVSDLNGVISGPQLIDRVGSMLSRATGRPARRLILFGGGFLVLSALVHVAGLRTLGAAMQFLSRYLGTPILALGAVALVLFLIGVWLQRIAGRASEVLERTAEAQHLNLLKLVKTTTLTSDLGLLHRRVLEPERRVLGPDQPRSPLDEAVQQLEQALHGWSPVIDSGDDHLADDRQRVLGMVRDYLDGAVFHASDHKTTQQLLGNLALRNLFEHRLSLTKAQRNELRRLDLSNESSFGGPYFWFVSITRTIAQRTAELVLEYNRHAVPERELARLSAEEHRLYESWLEKRLAGRPLRVEDARRLGFRTTAFTAIHFLSTDAEVEASVAARFGDQVLRALRRDRRVMIREVFGTSPLHHLPPQRRTLNPYVVYRRYVAGFRIFLLPLAMARVHLRFLGTLLRRFWQIVAEVRRPELVSATRRASVAGFDTAARKIGRMRLAAFLQCCWLRALTDLEYLGLTVPGLAATVEDGFFDDDLAVAGSHAYAWRERFVELRAQRRRDLKLLEAALQRRQVRADWVGPLLDDGAADAVGDIERRRVLRAVAVAFATDEDQCRSLLTAEPLLEAAIESIVEDPDQLPYRSVLRRAVDRVRALVGWLVAAADPLPRALDGYLDGREGDLSVAERRLLLRAARSNYRDVGRLLRVAGHPEHAGKTEEHGFARLRAAAVSRTRLAEELVTLRTVQTLSLLDLRNYLNLVCDLGEYTPEEGAHRVEIRDGRLVV